MELQFDQRVAASWFAERKSMFVTGEAGTGKSVLLRFLVDAARKQNRTPFIVATTGIAAEPLGGTTINAFAGVGIGKDAADIVVAKILKSPGLVETRERIRKCDVLLWDEISMCSSELFQKIDDVLRGVRRCDSPFGGIQLVLFGDFMQLQPVLAADVSGADRYLFLSATWRAVFKRSVIKLTQIFRQSDDLFVELLKRARRGRLDDADVEFLQTFVEPIGELVGGNRKAQEKEDEEDEDEESNVTFLEALNERVDRRNEAHLKRLPGAKLTVGERFTHSVKRRSASGKFDVVTHPIEHGHALFERARSFSKTLHGKSEFSFKVGAKVILTRNDADQRLVNGSFGTVISSSSSSPPAPSDSYVAQNRSNPHSVPPVPSSSSSSHPQPEVSVPARHEERKAKPGMPSHLNVLALYDLRKKYGPAFSPWQTPTQPHPTDRVEKYRAENDKRDHDRVEKYRAENDKRDHDRVEKYRAENDKRDDDKGEKLENEETRKRKSPWRDLYLSGSERKRDADPACTKEGQDDEVRKKNKVEPGASAGEDKKKEWVLVSFEATKTRGAVRYMVQMVERKFPLLAEEAGWPESRWSEWISVSRMPLILGYGVTIHKSQGMTLRRAHINLGSSVKQAGMAYVALSRLSSLDGLTLEAFNPRAFRSDNVICAYEDAIEKQQRKRNLALVTEQCKIARWLASAVRSLDPPAPMVKDRGWFSDVLEFAGLPTHPLCRNRIIEKHFSVS